MARLVTENVTNSLSANLSLGANVTKQPISNEFVITDNKSLAIDVVVSGVTESADVDIILQTTFDGGSTWVDAQNFDTVSSGTNSYEHLESDGLLRQRCRIVATTGAGDSLTVTSVHVSGYLQS